MRYALKRLFLGLCLIALASAVLLISDWHRRKTSDRHIERVAVFQFMSRNVLDESVRGCLDAFAQRGYVPGETIRIERFNAEGDLVTANAIAKTISDGNFDLAVTFSTPALQTLAAANAKGKIKHIFGAVTDPYASGVGFDRGKSAQRPKCLAGVGTFQPVAEVFRLARQCFPGLKRAGVVWNTSETCSEACVKLAREVCRELKIELVEAPVGNSTEIMEAAKALTGKGVQAIWVGGDNTVESFISGIVQTAAEARIPVFANSPDYAESGALIGLGADYYEVGRTTGYLAADVLKGRDPASIPVENVVPRELGINLKTLSGLRDSWQIPEEVLRLASVVVDAAGRKSERRAPLAAAAGGKKYKVAVVYFAPEMGVELAMKGLFDGLREEGLEEGNNLEVMRAHAQAEMANIQPILQNFDSSDADAIATFTTPVLSSACATVKTKPVVFNYVTDPIAAGAGKTLKDHLPFVTGVGGFPPLEETLDLIGKLVPEIRKLGVVYNSGEANSVKIVTTLRDLCVKRGMTLEEATIVNTTEASQAIQAILGRGVQAVYLPSDNTAYQAFDVLAKETQSAKIPLLIDQVEFADRGALAAIGVRYYDCAKRAGILLARVLRGENPSAIPMENLSVSQIAVNEKIAEKIGIRVSPEVKAMQKTFGDRAADTGDVATPPTRPSAAETGKRPYRLSFVSYVESDISEDVSAGFRERMNLRGFVEGRDYWLKAYSAQGDMANLSGIMDAVAGAQPDLLLAVSTPVLQAAIKKAAQLPTVFGAVASPVLAGAGKSNEDHLPQLTGISTESDFEGMCRAVREVLPKARRLGTLFVPAEVNSVYYKERFEAVASAFGFELVAVASATASEAADAAGALVGRNIDAVCQISDNVSEAAFPAILQAALKYRVPVFSFVSGKVERGGAVLAVARDFSQVGRDMADLSVRILDGEKPAGIPFRPVSRTRLIVNLENAGHFGLTLPASLIQRADEVVQKSRVHGNREEKRVRVA